MSLLQSKDRNWMGMLDFTTALFKAQKSEVSTIHLLRQTLNHISSTQHMKRLVLLVLLFALNFQIKATDYTFMVDVSGSVSGMSIDRNVNSMDFIRQELSEFVTESKPTDTISIVVFTDKVLKSICNTTATEKQVIGFINSIVPAQGNSNIINIIDGIDKERTDAKYVSVLISDGLENMSNKVNIDAFAQKRQGNSIYYMLLLDDGDIKTEIAKKYDNSQPNMRIIRKLSELRKNTNENKNETDSTIIVELSGDRTQLVDDNKSHPQTFIINWKLLITIILAVLLIILLTVAMYYIAPAFSQTSISGLQRLALAMFRMPSWLHKMILKITPKSFNKFMIDCMPSYDNFNRGYVIPQNDAQKELMQQTGIRLKYRNGEPDFSPVAKHTQKIPGGIKEYAKGDDPRKTIFKAQEEAGRQMLKSKDGARKIADYVGKSPENVTFDDYTAWKDDRLNQGKPNHNPLTPHETIDGKSIQFVPKKWHDANYGGFKHSGGVSMLKSIRQYFPNAN